ncbi:MAG: hypothetical protein HFE59_06555 [Clostridiales bacterium]|nr:hypothetical protein [Clostridiales bacterium]
MIYSRNYARMFVTLKQEISEYSYDFKEAMGRCVIEVRFGKGRFSTYIQGLRKGDYSIFFISCKGGRNIGVNMGKISADLGGKGELKTEFDPENIFGTKLKIEDFHVVAIMPFESATVKALLTGYVGGAVQWKEGFSFFKVNDGDSYDSFEAAKEESISESREETESDFSGNLKDSQDSEDFQKTQAEEIREEGTYGEISEESDEDYGEVTSNEEMGETETEIKDEENSDAYEAKKENEEETKADDDALDVENCACACEEIEEEEERENTSFKDLKEVGDNFNDIIKKFKKGIKEIEKLKDDKEKKELRKSKIINMEDVKEKNLKRNYALDYIFENNAKMTPFQSQRKDVEWVRIDLSELVVLPGKVWLYLNNPFVSFSEKKYKHLILGRFYEGGKEKYILGVPGKYFSDYRLEASIQGFKQFKCCENKLPVDGDYGYWILNIDKNLDKK